MNFERSRIPASNFVAESRKAVDLKHLTSCKSLVYATSQSMLKFPTLIRIASIITHKKVRCSPQLRVLARSVKFLRKHI